jgi:hypothetical protein
LKLLLWRFQKQPLSVKLFLYLLFMFRYAIHKSKCVQRASTRTHPWTNHRYYTCLRVLPDEGISEYVGELAASKWDMGIFRAQRPDTLPQS